MKTRYGVMPEEGLVDGGFTSLKAIAEAADRECSVYAPLKDEERQRDEGKDPYARKKGDSNAVAACDCLPIQGTGVRRIAKNQRLAAYSRHSPLLQSPLAKNS